MSAHEDLLSAVKHLRDRTGDPNAWQTGLSPDEVAAAITATARPEQLQVILGKIRQHHSDMSDVAAAAGPAAAPPPGAPPAPPDQEKGDAAEAIANAEAALAHQNSASSLLDMQVISAILNAHLKAVEGREELTKLQQETEAAVRTRSDLDTPAGARDFQRFLIGKLRDIRAVVLNASLDDTSKSALMAAWTSLYDASKGEPNGPREHPPTPAVDAGAPAPGATERSAEDPDTGWDPLLDSLLADDPGALPGDSARPGRTESTPGAPTAPVMPPIPNFGSGSLPGLGAAPASMAGWDPPGGLSGLGGGNDPALRDLDDTLDSEEHPGPNPNTSPEEAANHDADEDKDASTAPPSAGPATVTLPDGETVTVASPQLAAAIKAAVGGAPIPDAFQQQGITIPPPGTAVTNPVDPLQLAPGDIGIFTDRHALALGPDKVLLDGQIQHIASVSGPSFLGWEHPPAATTSLTAPAKPDPPAPTRPATSSAT